MGPTLNGFPKSGNHALAKACELLGVPATVNHIAYGSEPIDGPHLFIVRDPRDVVVSALRFLGRPVTEGTFISMVRSFNLDALGFSHELPPSLVASMGEYEGWLDEAFVVRYERLIADDREIRRIAESLEVPYLEDAFPNLPGHTMTWNSVRSDYRPLWTPTVRHAWTKAGGDELLRRWGYA